jgi:hypothetical protein
MRDTEHFKKHLSIVTWRQDNGGAVEKVDETPVEDPFHRTRVVLSWSLWDWLMFLFSRREIEIVVHVRSNGVSQGRWFQGADICEKCKREKIVGGYKHGRDERWCLSCENGWEIAAKASTTEASQ